MHSALNEESVLSSISDLFKSKKQADLDRNKGLKYLGGSISKYSKKLIMSFPLLCDNTIPIDTAMMISKANERSVTNMLQILFASMNLNFLDDNNIDGADIISAVYKGIDPNMDYNDFVDLISKLAGKEIGDDAAGTAAYYAKINTEDVHDLMEQFKAQRPFLYDSINESSINDYMVNNLRGQTLVSEVVKRSGSVMYQHVDDDKADANNYYNAIQTSNQIRGQEHREEEDRKRDAGETYDQYTKDLQINNDLNKARITNSDVRKANELEPTLMVINYNILAKDENGNKMVVDRKSFLAGIKSRFIPVESIDIVERFVSKDRNKLSLKNLIRATTGEIKFWKDFVLSLDKIKMDAKNASKKGPMAQYWSILEKRSNKNNLRKLQRSGNDGSAITTIALSQDTVNYMKNAYKFDLENMASARLMLDSYNLLGLIIADEATETVKVLYDGYTEFEVLSYNSLERDMNNKDYKKVVNLINQVGR